MLTAVALTITVRHAIDGPSPLFCHTANCAASGKTQLAKAAHYIAVGRDIPARNYPMTGRGRDRGENEEEIGKTATTCAIEGHVAYLLDNVPTGRGFGCGALDAMITATTESGRAMKTNSAPERDFRTVLIATGNNIRPVGDTVRRTIRIGLASTAERPEEVKYEGPEVTEWARADRGKLFTAAVTIAAAYIRAGRPAQAIKPLGSFEAWSGLVRSAVVWLGLPDPCSGKAKFVEEDEDRDRAAALIELVAMIAPNGQAVAAADICKRVRADLEAARPYDVDRKAWSLATAEEGDHPAIDHYRIVCPGVTIPDAHKLGFAFRRYKGRTIGGRRVEAAESDTHRKITLWRVVRVGGNGRRECGGNGQNTFPQNGPSFPPIDDPATGDDHFEGYEPASAGMGGNAAGIENTHSRRIPADANHCTEDTYVESAGMRGIIAPPLRDSDPSLSLGTCDSPMYGDRCGNNPRIPATDPKRDEPSSEPDHFQNGTDRGPPRTTPDGPTTYRTFTGEQFEEGEL